MGIIVATWGTLNEVVHSHGIKMQNPAATYTTMMRGHEYTLLQCHFHYGSEHTFGGSQHSLCMHCVHTGGLNGRYGVLGFTWEISATEPSDPFLDQFAAAEPSNIDMNLVLTGQNLAEYVQYD